MIDTKRRKGRCGKLGIALKRLKVYQKRQWAVAQVVEQLTFNQWVEGSNPSGLTNYPANIIIYFLKTPSLGHRAGTKQAF